jgi:hypothetical protein
MSYTNDSDLTSILAKFDFMLSYEKFVCVKQPIFKIKIIMISVLGGDQPRNK